MTKAEQIRAQANIEITNLHTAQEEGYITEYGRGALEALEGIVDFINILETKEAEEESSNSLIISQHGNPHIGDDLEEAATKYAQDKYLPVQTAQSFKAGAQWQKEQMIDKACNFLHHYQEYPNHDIATGSLIEAFKMFIEL